MNDTINKTKKFTDKFSKPFSAKKQVVEDEVEIEKINEEKLIEEISPLQAENDKLNKQLLVLAADYDNYRKRVTKDMEEASKYSITKFAKDLIEVLENLYRAEASVKVDEIEANSTIKQIFAGVELTKKSLVDIFERYGITRINPVGEPFNHDFHQAITEVPSPAHENGIVVQVIQAGYTLHGRLIRPALVAVAKN